MNEMYPSSIIRKINMARENYKKIHLVSIHNLFTSLNIDRLFENCNFKLITPFSVNIPCGWNHQNFLAIFSDKDADYSFLARDLF